MKSGNSMYEMKIIRWPGDFTPEEIMDLFGIEVKEENDKDES